MNDEIYGGFIATPAYRDMLFVQKTDAPWLCVKIMQMANEASIATFVSFFRKCMDNMRKQRNRDLDVSVGTLRLLAGICGDTRHLCLESPK